ncbi:hypothetical protein EXN22_17915 [Pseudomonas tructae]|uniref:Uncharacterized protein n=1 Tax=Pseudomonas tructae TaxID=2518644 RepID=A0A411ML19_9PSED|nr:hypothetical protein [Pseudomonas tructae]QBF27468.1 hypothetical protein EXN22_17915 [Pseudomonas tructae]
MIIAEMVQPERQGSYFSAHLRSVGIQTATVLWLVEEIGQSVAGALICDFEIPAGLTLNIYKPPKLGFFCFVAFKEVDVEIASLIIIRLSAYRDYRHRSPCNGEELFLKPQSDFIGLLGRERVRAKRKPFRNPFQLSTL